MFASLLPKSAPFFEMLLEQNSHLRHMSRLLLAMLEDLSKMDEGHKEIALIEEEADKLHVRIIRDLSQTFITPIDREDILRINQEQEEALDGLHTLSTRLHIFEFPTMRFPAVQLVRTICSMLDLTGEMLELIHSGTTNIICTQPFGCLPNHIVGKGVIKELRASHPEANIIAVDYDPGASEVNQLNRIKLMLSTAQKNLSEGKKDSRIG